MPDSSHNLNPHETAQAAEAVYGIRTSDNAAEEFKGTKIKDHFILGDDARFKGKSGIFRSASGFGVIGKGTGSRQGEVVIITRGTVTAADWYNNALDVSTQSANNKIVHKGFNQIFNSLKNELAIQLRPLNPTRVHCIGHSLGGALANLIAEWVDAKGMGQAHIYTFGSPRVGKNSFAESLTYNLGADRINRAYHKTDIVPMVPVWPFVHGPQPGLSCFINSPGDFPGGKYHDKELYKDSMLGHNDWSSLRQRHPKTNMEKQVENWLDSDSPLSLTGNTISMINTAILYVIKKLALAGIQLFIGSAVNIVDVLANYLAKAVHVTKEVSSLIGRLMMRILRALGKVVTSVKNITFSFIKWVLESLAAAMYQTAKMAVGIAHRFL
jgi:hypothetical protein